jgi:threonyl-tRNA synthetase
MKQSPNILKSNQLIIQSFLIMLVIKKLSKTQDVSFPSFIESNSVSIDLKLDFNIDGIYIKKINNFLDNLNKDELIFNFKSLNNEQAKNEILNSNFTLKKSILNNLETNNKYIQVSVNDISTQKFLFTDIVINENMQLIEGDFKIESVMQIEQFSSVYWNQDSNNPTVQRIKLLVEENNEKLMNSLLVKDNLKERDHKKLNQHLFYYAISDSVGQGLPLIQNKGFIIRDLIQKLLWQLHKDKGYQQVWTPHIANKKLYETSGHSEHYLNDMFKVIGGTSGDEFYLKPMNCPHHMQLYISNNYTFKDLPVRYFEHATVYRDEKTGQLGGLTRVRSITQDDGHVFCRQNQIEAEVDIIIENIVQFMKIFNLKPSWVSLSTRDESDNWLGEKPLWSIAENSLNNSALKNNIEVRKTPGEAAFYGPKLDFQFTDVMNREWQLSTIQLDFNLPKRFNLEFSDENNKSELPVVIHRAISGSAERFLGLLMEQYEGRFPLWLSPIQTRIISVKSESINYCKEIEMILNNTILKFPLKYNEIRYDNDYRDENLSTKVKDAEISKIPVLIILGPNDEKESQVSIRYGDQKFIVKKQDLSEWFLNIDTK